MVLRQFPTFLELDKWQAVRRITINLICRCKNKDRVWAMLTHIFKHNQCASSVNAKISKRLFGCPVMRRLGSGMYDDVEFVFLEDLSNTFAVAYVGRIVGV